MRNYIYEVQVHIDSYIIRPVIKIVDFVAIRHIMVDEEDFNVNKEINVVLHYKMVLVALGIVYDVHLRIGNSKVEEVEGNFQEVIIDGKEEKVCITVSDFDKEDATVSAKVIIVIGRKEVPFQRTIDDYRRKSKKVARLDNIILGLGVNGTKEGRKEERRIQKGNVRISLERKTVRTGQTIAVLRRIKKGLPGLLQIKEN